MSLNCLSCGGHTEPKREMELEHGRDDAPCAARCFGVDRCWSGELTPPPLYANLRSRSIPADPPGDKQKGHRKIASTRSPLLGGSTDAREAGAAAEEEPRLVRSGGMRRDWSFEDPRERMAGVVKGLDRGKW
ncbi:hypothetical protein B296_00051740 [Ensete ventricosum]|uniref:Uncharacterized protein n=1 Tax=Ensete ventricosum TaxID=4639 RepID=A0A426Y1Y3_ENSVE|nr:hypothetical protein B296_00051740 [Ensete ventricosum]